MKDEQGQQQDKKTEVSLAEIFFLDPEIKKRLHPYAAERYYTWLIEVFRAITQLTTDEKVDVGVDLDTYLNDDDKALVNKYKQNILEWHHKCTNIVKGSSHAPYDTTVNTDMKGFKALIVKAYKARAEKLEAEEKHRQWEEASRHVFPLKLLKEAKRYLNKDDIDKLYKASGVAIKVYLKEGDSYLDSYKTYDYRWYLRKINYEKEKEQIRLDAEAQAQAFCPRLDQGLKEIERKLSPKKEAPAVRFKRYCSNKGEARYLGESFADILGDDDDGKNNWTQGYIPAAEAKLLKFIPKELRDFILTKPTAVFFLLPSANYSHCGVPCLDFYFDVFAVVTITVSAQAGQKVFNGYNFNFLTNLREPKLLGFYQITITPNEPDFWQSVPVSIIRAFIDRNLQPPGITILERTDELTVYEVKKFKEDICAIHISFERYCHSLGSFEKMRELGIIKERTAEILELPRPISINHKENKSKKAKAFKFFSKGKRPSDSEVKNLGIKPESAYRYYQGWKKEATVGNNRI